MPPQVLYMLCNVRLMAVSYSRNSSSPSGVVISGSLECIGASVVEFLICHTLVNCASVRWRCSAGSILTLETISTSSLWNSFPASRGARKTSSKGIFSFRGDVVVVVGGTVVVGVAGLSTVPSPGATVVVVAGGIVVVVVVVGSVVVVVVVVVGTVAVIVAGCMVVVVLLADDGVASGTVLAAGAVVVGAVSGVGRLAVPVPPQPAAARVSRAADTKAAWKVMSPYYQRELRLAYLSRLTGQVEAEHLTGIRFHYDTWQRTGHGNATDLFVYWFEFRQQGIQKMQWSVRGVRHRRLRGGRLWRCLRCRR